MKKYISSLIYVLITALSPLLIHFGSVALPPIWILFVGTILASLYFHLINIHKIKAMYQAAWQHKKHWLSLMVLVSVIWPCTFYGSSLGPTVFILIYFVIMTLLGLFSYSRAYPQTRVIVCITGFGLLILLGILFGHFYFIKSLPLLGFSVVAGLSGFLYKKQSYAFSKETHLKPTQILALRFWLLILLCAFLAPKISPDSFFTWSNLWIILVIAVTSLILPLYFNQKGIMDAGPDKNAIICGYTPTGTYLLGVLFHAQSCNFMILLLYLLIGFLIGLPFLMKNKIAQ